MRVGVVCADAGVADAAAGAVTAAGGSPLLALSVGQLALTWRTLAAAVVDVGTAEALAAAPMPTGPVLIVAVPAAESAGAWGVAARIGAATVVALPEGQQVLLDAVSAAPRLRGPQGSVLAVVGAGSGAGASTLAVVLAAAAAATGRRTALVDLDPLGGGVDLLVGAERIEGTRWADLDRDPALAGDGLAARLPAVDGVRVLSWDRQPPRRALPAGVLAAALGALQAAADVIVLDVPRGAADSGVLAGSDEALLVASRQVRAAAAAAVLADICSGQSTRLRVVAGGAAPPEIGPRDLADTVGLPLAATVGRDARIPRHGSLGALHRLPRRNPTVRTCRRLLETSLAGLGASG